MTRNIYSRTEFHAKIAFNNFVKTNPEIARELFYYIDDSKITDFDFQKKIKKYLKEQKDEQECERNKATEPEVLEHRGQILINLDDMGHRKKWVDECPGNKATCDQYINYGYSCPKYCVGRQGKRR